MPHPAISSRWAEEEAFVVTAPRTAAEKDPPPFPPEEYARRVAATRVEMEKRGADLLLVDCLEHMVYLFGYTPPAAIYQPALLPLFGEPVAIVRALDRSMFLEQSWVVETVTFSDWEDPVAALAEAVSSRGWTAKTIAVELDSHFLPVGRFRAIERRLPNARFIDFSGVLKQLRLYKSEREMAVLRRCGEIADAALMVAVNAAAVGVSERECAAALYAAAIREGADSQRAALMASGGRSDSLHGRLGHHVLEAGDILHTESIPLLRGYGARLMRSTAIGGATAAQQDAAKRMIELQDRQYEAMRPGAAAREVDAILRQGMVEAGLRADYLNITGYTLGFIGLPVTSDFTRVFLPESDWELRPGMVFHMYTYAAGMAFSDTVAVTATGAERLTLAERCLFVR
jgi:Xaa-Pro aminopeptidase